VRLFDRRGRGLTPTEAGASMLERAERIEAEVVAAERELAGRDASLRGSVRITAGDGMAHSVLLPALGELRRTHPGIAVELRADTRVLDLSRREADVALRLFRPVEPVLVGRRLGTVHFSLCAGHRYLERAGTPRTVADLAGHDWIGFDASQDELPQTRWLHRQVPGLEWTLRTTTTASQVIAVAEGHGLALLPRFVAVRDPRLVTVLPSLSPPTRELWLVVHEDMRNNARVAAVMSWLARTVTSALA
jgi:DNA-binding transcriptional LysR family regulator